MKKVMIDPGHGGCFSGAVGMRQTVTGEFQRVKECDINLAAAKILARLLNAAEIEVSLTREYDINFSTNVTRDLQARCDLESAYNPDCFVSIHCNAADAIFASGFEVWTSIGSTKADRLAEEIYKHVGIMTTPPRMRADTEDGDHDREAHLYVLDHTRCPAVLIELGFMSNPTELEKLCSQVYLEEIMNSVADGVKEWLAG